jgi:hypothetical protein
MGWRGPPNCQHLDNWRGCRVHRPHWLIAAFFPSARPRCILDRDDQPRDGVWTCSDQAPYPRPAGPPPKPKKV